MAHGLEESDARAKENGPVYPTSNVPSSACEIPPDPSAMDRDYVAIGILEGEGQVDDNFVRYLRLQDATNEFWIRKGDLTP
jgi:hypothetical protein